MIALYQTLTRLISPIVGVYGHFQRDPAWPERLAQELPTLPTAPLWIHGASVGEARLVKMLVRGLREQDPTRPIVASAVTGTGIDQLATIDPALPHFRWPLDLPSAVSRALDHVDPSAVWLVETELWPNFLRAYRRCSRPLRVANARLAPEKMARYLRFRSLYRDAFYTQTRIAAQTDADAERFVQLGAADACVRVCGNLKFDLGVPRASDQVPHDGSLWIAGSTRPGEEEMLLQAFGTLRSQHPSLTLMLAPRHIERAAEVEQMTQTQGWEVRRWSQRQPGSRPAVWILDTLGELASLYSQATFAFIGGSLRPFGGHSPLEPAAAGCPVLFGPHMHHFELPARVLIDGGGAFEVRGPDDLARLASSWIADPNARAGVAAAAASSMAPHQGALQRTLDWLAA